MNIRVHTKVLLVRSDGRILVVKRSLDDNRRAGEWDLPGGGVEPGENPTQGAIREVSEEVGIALSPEQLELFYAETAPYLPGNDSNTRLMYITKIDEALTGNVVLSDEHSEFRWQQPVETAAGFPHPVYLRGLEYALEHGLLS